MIGLALTIAVLFGAWIVWGNDRDDFDITID